MNTTRIYLIGGGGVGKSTLLDLFVETSHATVHKINEVARPLMKELGVKQDDLSDDELFLDLQRKIAKRQLNEERRQDRINANIIISDRSVIDALAYAMLRFPGGLPMAENAQGHLNSSRNVFNELSSLVGSREAASEVVDRYQNSLLVLVHPFNDNSAMDDKVRLIMSNAELLSFTSKCREILTLLDINFIQMKERTRLGRLTILREAARHYKTRPSV